MRHEVSAMPKASQTSSDNSFFYSTLEGANISHLGKKKIILNSDFWWDMLASRTVLFLLKLHVHLQRNSSWCQSEWWLTKPYIGWYNLSTVFTLPKTNLAPKFNRNNIFPTFLGSARLVVGRVPIYIYIPSGCIQWGQHKEFGTLPWRPSCWKCYGVLVLGRKSPGLFRKQKSSGWWK